jgi:hypothetical protein
LFDGGAGDGATSLAYKRVFVTSSTFVPGGSGPNAFDGIARADTRCQMAALAGAKTGNATTATYRAWLSSSTSSPSVSFMKANEPYMLVDGTSVVAKSWTDLTSGNIVTAIGLDEDGNPVGDLVWTATKTDGTFTGLADCGDWSDATSSMLGGIGNSSSVLSWSMDGNTQCNTPQHLYCFEQ